jgi:hypothetical protein
MKRLKRAGLVATQAIRRGANRKMLDRILAVSTIYDAWADEPWVIEGAAVRVSLICFGSMSIRNHAWMATLSRKSIAIFPVMYPI